jgi:hypothetical protein
MTSPREARFANGLQTNANERPEAVRVGKVSELERQRVERLAHELAPVLRDRGQARTGPGENDVDRWRRAARRAARLLGVPIRTGRGPDGGAWAALDRPLSDVDLEQAADALDRASSEARAERHGGVRESPPG